MKPIGVLYEHPEWFRPLFQELDRRGVPYEPIHAASHVFDPAEQSSPYSVLVNRMSPSAWMRGHGEAIFGTLEYLAYLEEIGAQVLNGHRSYRYEISKARQLSLFARLGVRYPIARVITLPAQASAAAEALQFPVMVKPNVGGSGAGIRSFGSQDELRAASTGGEIDFGIDGVALVQEHLPSRGESVVRIEILDGRYLYAIRLNLVPGSFNLCPADYCDLPGIADGVSGRGVPIEAYDPPEEVIADALKILAATGADVGGIEYLVNDRDGRPYFYDVNALSNFVADAPTLLGFDPFVDLVDLIVRRSGDPVEAAV